MTPALIEYTTADGTAHAGEDYTTTAGSISDVDGAFSQTVSVPVTGDTAVEPDEAFTLVVYLAPQSGAGGAIGPFTGTATITNDDAPVPDAVTGSTAVADPSTGNNTTGRSVTVRAAAGA